MFSQFSYYDIRHPAIHIVIFPIWAVIHTILQWTAPDQLVDILCASCIQIINIQALLLSGIMIKKLSGSRWTLALYLVSYSVLEYVMFFEKYQIIVFFLVLYVYQLCRKKKGARAGIILAIGAMPSNVFLCAAELVLKKTARGILQEVLTTAVLGIAVVICAGRIYLLNPKTIADAGQMLQSFGKHGLPIETCIFSFTKMVHGMLLPLDAVKEPGYIWADILNTPSMIGVIVLAVMVLGFFVSCQESFSKICFVWTGFSVILICMFQWSTQESPLFSILFTWAWIPLFQKGFQFVIDKCHWKQNIAYGILLIFVFSINIVSLIDIGKYLAAA